MLVSKLPVVLLAMSVEFGVLRREAEVVSSVAGRPGVWRVRIGGVETHVMVTGQGRHRADKAARWAIEALEPSAMIAAGIAGGTLPHQRPGDLIVLDASDHATATNPAGDRVTADSRLTNALDDVLRSMGCSYDLGLGAGVEGVASRQTKQRLGQLGIVGVDMESYWVMAAAAEAGIPAAGLRAIADRVDHTVPQSLLGLGGFEGGRWWPEIRSVWRMPLELRSVLRTLWDTRTATEALVRGLREVLPAIVGDPQVTHN